MLVSVTVIDVVLNRRSERRWRLLAQYALLELAETAHAAWAVLVRVVDAEDIGNHQLADPAHITRILDSPERAPTLKRTIEALLTDARARDQLRQSLDQTLDTSRGLIGRWGVVLTGSSTYSELFDSHVEMIGRIHGLWHFLARPLKKSAVGEIGGQKSLVVRPEGLRTPHNASPFRGAARLPTFSAVSRASDTLGHDRPTA